MKTHLLLAATALSAALSACGAPPSDNTSSVSGDQTVTTWKTALMTGDDSINAFDNARETIASMWQEGGVASENIKQLSRGRSGGGVLPTSAANLEAALSDLNVGNNDGCVLFMTSHGSRQGFYIRGQSTLTPARLDEILDNTCGDRPTVALISACYSGVNVPALQAPNRTILTAARADRTSFGCSAEAEYTYWDSCVIEHFADSGTWQNLYATVKACIVEKEGRGGFTPSEPQLSVGADMQNLAIF